MVYPPNSHCGGLQACIKLLHGCDLYVSLSPVQTQTEEQAISRQKSIPSSPVLLVSQAMGFYLPALLVHTGSETDTSGRWTFLSGATFKNLHLNSQAGTALYLPFFRLYLPRTSVFSQVFTFMT